MNPVDHVRGPKICGLRAHTGSFPEFLGIRNIVRTRLRFHELAGGLPLDHILEIRRIRVMDVEEVCHIHVVVDDLPAV
ncbi:Uncharacterised protein [Mycobacteroides abscessus subsp. abscessus]|nr:Uncharacterised protein [Mycobacteroides abscessus subsp. abscessus]